MAEGVKRAVIPRPPLDTVAAVETPEHVRFHHHLAGPSQRAFAYLLDLLIRIAIVATLLFLAVLGGVSAGEQTGGSMMGLMLLVLFLMEWGYFVACESLWSGASPGKRAFGLRVITQSGQPLNLLDSMLRNLLRAADFLPAGYALGLLVMSRDSSFRRLGDLVAGTMVVVEQRFQVEGPVRIVPPPTAAELEALPQRPVLSGDELESLELYLRRLPNLPPARAEELAEIIAPVYAERLCVRFPGAAQRFLAVLYHRARVRAATP